MLYSAEPWQRLNCYSWHSQFLTTSWLLLFEAKCQSYANQTGILIAKCTLGNKINTSKRFLRNLDKFLIECNDIQKFIKSEKKKKFSAFHYLCISMIFFTRIIFFHVLFNCFVLSLWIALCLSVCLSLSLSVSLSLSLSYFNFFSPIFPSVYNLHSFLWPTFL